MMDLDFFLKTRLVWQVQLEYAADVMPSQSPTHIAYVANSITDWWTEGQTDLLSHTLTMQEGSVMDRWMYAWMNRCTEK